MILRAHFMDVLLLSFLNVVGLCDYAVTWVKEGPGLVVSEGLFVHQRAVILFTTNHTLIHLLHTAYRQTVLAYILQQIPSR